MIELIESVKSQSYKNWELCFADGSDEDHRYVEDICEKCSSKDARIRYKKLSENKGISENTNECLKMATGDYFGLLDHDDLLHASALFEVMCAIEKYNADFIYTDEVKFSGKIENVDSVTAFNFKPGFGKYDLRSHNYICHFTVFNRKLLDEESGLYRPEYDGSQDHDMVLRLTEKADRIVHIPKVLYYWRLHSNSVSLDLDSKSYAVDAAIRAVTAQLDRNSEAGKVASNLPFQTIYRIQYKIENRPLVSIVLHNAHKIDEIVSCINKIVNNTAYRPLQIIYSDKKNVVDNKYANVEIKNVDIANNTYRTKQWNQMIEKTNGDFIVLMDVQCVPLNKEWLEEMLMLSQKDDVCVVGPKIIYRDQTVAYAGGVLWKKEKLKVRLIGTHDTVSDIGYEAILCHVRNTSFALASCMMFAKKTWYALGAFEESGSGYEDVEFCLKGLESDKSNVWTCFAVLQFAGKNIFPTVSAEKVQEFETKYEKCFEKERYFHPKWDELGLV